MLQRRSSGTADTSPHRGGSGRQEELFITERLRLKPLPPLIPKVYRVHQRTVDVEEYVSVNSIRYPVPVAWTGRRVEIRETRDKLVIGLDARHIATHDRALMTLSRRIRLAEHRAPRGEGVKRSDSHPEEAKKRCPSTRRHNAGDRTFIYISALNLKTAVTYHTRAVLLSSQLPVAKWHAQIGDPTLQGESMRKKRSGRSGKDSDPEPTATDNIQSQ